MKQNLPLHHPAVPDAKTGVLLVNLGTPDGYDTRNMRRYLGEFLSDQRVIEAPKWLWWPLLHGIILNSRPKKSGKAYQKIWMEDQDESPLRYYTRAQSEGLSARLSKENVVIDWAMRYGTRSIGERIDFLLREGCRQILLAPLYPQYSAATTASVVDTCFDHLKSLRWQPALRTMPPFYDDSAYIEALARSVRAELKGKEDPEYLICSFHGLPKENLDKGDPYHCFCQKTARLLRDALDWPEDHFQIVFQSRFGPKEWLQPYAEETITQLARNGISSIAMISPGFVVDCVETLEEIAIGLKEVFETNGGQNFTYIPCLNADKIMIDMLETLIRRELSGWI